MILIGGGKLTSARKKHDETPQQATSFPGDWHTLRKVYYNAGLHELAKKINPSNRHSFFSKVESFILYLIVWLMLFIKNNVKVTYLKKLKACMQNVPTCTSFPCFLYQYPYMHHVSMPVSSSPHMLSFLAFYLVSTISNSLIMSYSR